MSHLRVTKLDWKDGMVTCRGTANNIDPYDYKPLTWECTLEKFYQDIMEGQIVPTTACNDYKWTVLYNECTGRNPNHRFGYFQYMLEHSPKGLYVLRFVRNTDVEHMGKYIKEITKKEVTLCNDIGKCLPMNYWKAKWITQTVIPLKDCAIVKLGRIKNNQV